MFKKKNAQHMNASVSHHYWASILLQTAFLLIIKLTLQFHSSIFVFILKDRYYRKSFHLLVNITFPPFTFCTLLLLFISHFYFFPYQSLPSIQSFFFLLFSFQQHFFLLSSDTLFITRDMWKKNSLGVFSLPPWRKVADTVVLPSKAQSWAPEVHTLHQPCFSSAMLHTFSRQPWC